MDIYITHGDEKLSSQERRGDAYKGEMFDPVTSGICALRIIPELLIGHYNGKIRQIGLPPTLGVAIIEGYANSCEFGKSKIIGAYNACTAT